jgi:hypothetical protein
MGESQRLMPTADSALGVPAIPEVLAYLFPIHAEFIRAVGKEGGDSRIWAGIHHEMDNRAGVHSVGQSQGNSSSGQKQTEQTSGSRGHLLDPFLPVAG